MTRFTSLDDEDSCDLYNEGGKLEEEHEEDPFAPGEKYQAPWSPSNDIPFAREYSQYIHIVSQTSNLPTVLGELRRLTIARVLQREPSLKANGWLRERNNVTDIDLFGGFTTQGIDGQLKSFVTEVSDSEAIIQWTLDRAYDQKTKVWTERIPVHESPVTLGNLTHRIKNVMNMDAWSTKIHEMIHTIFKDKFVVRSKERLARVIYTLYRLCDSSMLKALFTLAYVIIRAFDNEQATTLDDALISVYVADYLLLKYTPLIEFTSQTKQNSAHLIAAANDPSLFAAFCNHKNEYDLFWCDDIFAMMPIDWALMNYYMDATPRRRMVVALTATMSGLLQKFENPLIWTTGFAERVRVLRKCASDVIDSGWSSMLPEYICTRRAVARKLILPDYTSFQIYQVDGTAMEFGTPPKSAETWTLPSEEKAISEKVASLKILIANIGSCDDDTLHRFCLVEKIADLYDVPAAGESLQKEFESFSMNPFPKSDVCGVKVFPYNLEYCSFIGVEGPISTVALKRAQSFIPAPVFMEMRDFLTFLIWIDNFHTEALEHYLGRCTHACKAMVGNGRKRATPVPRYCTAKRSKNDRSAIVY